MTLTIITTESIIDTIFTRGNQKVAVNKGVTMAVLPKTARAKRLFRNHKELPISEWTRYKQGIHKQKHKNTISKQHIHHDTQYIITALQLIEQITNSHTNEITIAHSPNHHMLHIIHNEIEILIAPIITHTPLTCADENPVMQTHKYPPKQ